MDMGRRYIVERDNVTEIGRREGEGYEMGRREGLSRKRHKTIDEMRMGRKDRESL